MRILFIEDEPVKFSDISNLLFENLCEVELVEAGSYTRGILELRNAVFDYMLLDMSLPLYDHSPNIIEQNEFETFAGLDILDEVCRLNIKLKTIVITAFDVLGNNEYQIDLRQLDLKMKSDYPEIYLGVIHYNASSLEWRKSLISLFSSTSKCI